MTDNIDILGERCFFEFLLGFLIIGSFRTGADFCWGSFCSQVGEFSGGFRCFVFHIFILVLLISSVSFGLDLPRGDMADLAFLVQQGDLPTHCLSL